MDKKIRELRERLRYADKKEIAAIDKEMDKLAIEDQAAFSKGMLKLAKETSKAAGELLLAEKLKDVLPAISISYFSKTYFNKTPQWFYQRLNGNTVNGKTAKFTHAELKTLSLALKDVGKQITNSASRIL
jgi:hypothetical protein